MKFTLSWLKDHLDTTATINDICDKLVELGLEVESVHNPADQLKGFVIGHVVSREKHPNADRLSLCMVDAGDKDLVQVVCGAPNVRQGMKVAFAPLGTVIPNTGEALKKGKIRDVESLGMLCSARELLLGEDSDGIMDLATEAMPGTALIEALDLSDPVIEIAITPNRADCFGIRGIARDLAASGLGTLRPLSYKTAPATFKSPINVEIKDADACPHFCGVYIKGVKNGPSPEWVQRRLEAVGLRPLNALVDVTNYLSYDLCRPLHVFDADKISSDITVRLSKAGEMLEALNGKTYELNDEMTIITANNNVLALGGIMGGEASSCTESTTNVLLECALFDPIRIANTGRSLNILSDARTRNERGIDPLSQEYGIQAAISLILEWCGGVASEVVEAKGSRSLESLIPNQEIQLTQARLKSLSGCNISLLQAKGYLEKLGFIVKSKDDGLAVIAPSHRVDIEGSADLVEEVLRLYGYDSLPSAPLPQLEVKGVIKTKADIMRRALAARGFNEIVSWSFMAEEKAALFANAEPSLKLTNPISHDLSVMRPTALANHIDAVVRNENRGFSNLSLFEVGPHFHTKGQHLVAAGLRSGKTHTRHWLSQQRSVDAFDVKADVQAIFSSLGINESAYQIDVTAPTYYHPGRSGCFKQGQKVLAHFGEIHPKVLKSLGTTLPIVAFEIYLDNINDSKGKKAVFTPSPYQSVTRDFAFVVEKSVKADLLIKTIQKVDKALIADVQIFDVYTGDKISDNQKSIAVEIKLEPSKGTLTEAEINDISDRIITSVATATGASLRQ